MLLSPGKDWMFDYKSPGNLQYSKGYVAEAPWIWNPQVLFTTNKMAVW